MSEIAIVGIGNTFRGDDGAGWAVIDALNGQVPTPITLCKVRGEVTELIDLFADYPTLYLIDACRSGNPPGSWQRIDALQEPLLLQNTQTSTHGLSLGEALSLAKALEQLPQKLIVYAIEGEHYQMSTQLSPPLLGAVQQVSQQIIQEITNA